jgi:hypothetical protein
LDLRNVVAASIFHEATVHFTNGDLVENGRGLGLGAAGRGALRGAPKERFDLGAPRVKIITVKLKVPKRKDSFSNVKNYFLK